MARSFDEQVLRSLRELPLAQALEAVQMHVSVDADFVPVKNSGSQRWVVTSTSGTTELVVTGAKWYDTRVRRGGGGAVDLVMHLEALDFVGAVNRLRRGLAGAGGAAPTRRSRKDRGGGRGPEWQGGSGRGKASSLYL